MQLIHDDVSVNDQLTTTINRSPPIDGYHKPYRKTKLFLCGLCLATYGTVETGHFSFSTALLQHLDNKSSSLSAASAAHVMSILSATYTLGRFTSAFISITIQPDVIISFHFGIIITAITILFYGRDQLWYITMATGLLGYGFSAMWPAMFAFTERHLRLSDKVCSLYSFLSGAVSLVIPLVLAQSFRSHPLILFSLEAIFITISLILFILVKLWILIDNNNNNNNNIIVRRGSVTSRNNGNISTVVIDSERNNHSHIY